MEQVLSVTLVLFLIGCIITGCGTTAVIDYESAADFEAALNNGEDLTGKTVTFTVKAIAPDSAFGFNLQAGENLNFCSTKNPGAKEGDTITVKVVGVQSVLGSYIISYEKM